MNCIQNFLWSLNQKVCMRAALTAVPAVLLRLPTVSEADVSAMAVEVEVSHQYFITCLCHGTGGSKGAVWQNGIWHESAHEAKVCHLFHSLWKNKMAPIDIHRLLWNAYGNSGCEHCEAAGGVSAVVTATWGHLHRCRFWRVQHAGSCITYENA